MQKNNEGIERKSDAFQNSGLEKVNGVISSLNIVTSRHKNPLNEFRSNDRKRIYALKENIVAIINNHGIERVGVVTTTFPDFIIDARDANNRVARLTRKLTKRYLHWLVVMERHKSNRVHFHILGFLREDIRSGLRFNKAGKIIRNTANAKLRDEWDFLNKAASKIGLGRTEILPIKTNCNKIADYFSKSLCNHVLARLPEDKGVRTVRYSRNFPRAIGPQFGWVSPKARQYRLNLDKFVRSIPQIKLPADATEDEFRAVMRQYYGKNWQFNAGPYLFGDQAQDPSATPPALEGPGPQQGGSAS